MNAAFWPWQQRAKSTWKLSTTFFKIVSRLIFGMLRILVGKLSTFSPDGNMRARIIPNVRPVIKVTTSIPIVRVCVWAYIQDWNEIALLGMLCVLRPLQHWSTTSSVCPTGCLFCIYAIKAIYWKWLDSN